MQTNNSIAQAVVSKLLELRQVHRVKPGRWYWFEYKCFESPRSADADLWYRSHRRIKVIKMLDAGGGVDEYERGFNGQPAAYSIVFKDGFSHTATEDEILDSREEFTRPDPPKKVAQ